MTDVSKHVYLRYIERKDFRDFQLHSVAPINTEKATIQMVENS